MTAAERKTYKKFTGRSDVPAKQFKEAYLICGRRSGKSAIASLIAIFMAVFRDYSDILRPGEVADVVCLAPDRRQAKIIFDYVNAFLEIPILKHMVLLRLKESIQLDNNVRIVIRTSSYKSVRGFTCVCVIGDEIAFMMDDLGSANPAQALFEALRPSMATVHEPLLIGLSSPYARAGLLWDMFRQHYGRDVSKVLIWKADSRSMNPTLDKETVEEAYARDPQAADSEYGANFRDDVSTIFSQEILEARIVRGRHELPPNPDCSYHGFIDPSGGRGDSMTIGIAHVQRDVVVLDLLREVMPPFSPETVAGEFAAVLKAYGLSECTGDSYGGNWCAEVFARYGVNYRVASENRSQLYLRLLPAVMAAQVELLDNAKMVLQLVGLERRTSPGGKDAINHAQGSHDDVANSAAGAIALVLMTNSLGQLGLVDLIKRKALGVASGVLDAFSLDRRESSVRTLSGTAAGVGGVIRGVPKSGDRCPNPRCGSTATWAHSDGEGEVVLSCNQCGSKNGVPREIAEALPADGMHCGAPIRITGQKWRCQNCDASWWPNGVAQVTTGATKKQTEALKEDARRPVFGRRRSGAKYGI
jgi:hypothetical protein